MASKLKSMTFAAALAAVASMPAAPAVAGPDPFVGEMMLVPYNFCPRGWANAEGQLMAISQNSALFSLIGTQFGGDGRTTFALPDMRGRVPLGQGNGAGLSNVVVGQKGGAEQVSIGVANMPPHAHDAQTTATAAVTAHAVSTPGIAATPGGNVLARSLGGNIYSNATPNAQLADGAVEATVTATTTVANSGGGQPLNVRNPYLGMRWCIALQGVFPSRN